MAEGRAVTGREIKSSVEGYQEMSDEAFARRFYSDRAELQTLGVPLTSQRDEYTGEELYNMRSERYFLPPLELTDEELAALQTCLYLLEGRFAYAEPLRRPGPGPRGRGGSSVPRRAAGAPPAGGPVSTPPSPAAARRGRSATSSARRGSRSPATRPGGCNAPTATAGGSRKASSSPSTRRCRCWPRGFCARTGGRSHRPRTTSAARPQRR